MVKVEFLCGDGSGGVEIEVSYIATGGRVIGPGGECAFCHGDPCNEFSPEDSPIASYFARNRNADSCPLCEGRPS